MKKIIKDNYRVVVYPDQPEWRELDYILSDCENIIAQIKRHVDDVKEIKIEHDTKEVCSFCGYSWEYLPECCDEAVKEWENKDE